MEPLTPIIKKKQENNDLKDKEGKNYIFNLSYDENSIYFDVFYKSDILKEKYFLKTDLKGLKQSCKTFIF